ncbi:hypothetical protein [Natronospora cellulosivora (SeqCode)]
MKSKRKYLIIVIFLAIIIILISTNRVHLYRSEMNSSRSVSKSVSGKDNYMASNYADRIGILITDLSQETSIKERQAHYLKEYLLASGYPEVYLLQGENYDNETVDLILLLDLEMDLSPMPFYKKGNYNYAITTISYFDGPEYYGQDQFSIRFSGEKNIKFYGLISRRLGHNLLTEAAARNFVEDFNKNLNESFATNYTENLEKINILSSNLRLRNSLEDSLYQQYSHLLPDNSEDIFIYQDNRMGEKTIISLVSEKSIEELDDFYLEIIEGRDQEHHGFFEYVGGRRVFEGFFPYEENIKIDIKYLEERDYLSLDEFSGEYVIEDIELDRKIINIIVQEPSLPVQILMGIYWPDTNLNQLQEVLLKESSEKDFYYFLALTRLQLLQLEEKVEQGLQIDEQLFAAALEVAANLDNNNFYPGADSFYRAQIYQIAADNFDDSSFMHKAVEEYKGLVNRYGKRFYGYGASKELEELEKNKENR